MLQNTVAQPPKKLPQGKLPSIMNSKLLLEKKLQHNRMIEATPNYNLIKSSVDESKGDVLMDSISKLNPIIRSLIPLSAYRKIKFL